jgi:hypothetical protein
MAVENVGVNATFYVNGGFTVYKGGDGKWYVSIAASGHTPNSRIGDVNFSGKVTMTVDGKTIQQQRLAVPDGPVIGPSKQSGQFIGAVTMQLPNSGTVRINLSVNYFIQFGSQGNRSSTTYNKDISIRTIGLPRK